METAERAEGNMKTFNAPRELNALPDGTVIMLSTHNARYGVAAQKDAGLWFVVGADPHAGQSSTEMASHAPLYDLAFEGVVLWEPVPASTPDVSK